MLLDCPAESLPAQHEFEKRDDYGKALRVFLDRHHGLTYVEVDAARFATVPEQFKRFHVLIGECPRTTAENNFARHAIIGSNGEQFWDVSETRAGLTKVECYGLLIPTPADWKAAFSSEDCVCFDCRRDRARSAEAA
jgi:hypothetical protein